MTWRFFGNCADVRLGLSESGDMMFHGWPSTSECRPTVINDYKLIQRFESAKITWTICLPSESKEIFAADMLSRNVPTLAERIRDAPDARHASMSFHTQDSDCLSMLLVVPANSHATIERMLAISAMSTSVNYEICVDFIGFILPGAPSNTPTELEFLAGTPIYLDNFDFSIHASASAA